MNKPAHDLASMPKTSRLARYTTWNLLGMTLPMAVALVAIPMLIDGLGNARFGVLSLVWVLVGYFSIFDFGLGRALTRMTAAKFGQSRDDEVPALFWTSMILMTVIGVIGATAIALASRWLAYTALNIDPELQAETCHAFYLVAVCTPVVITTVGLIGMLEAHQRFGLLNSIRLPMGIFTFIGPLLVLPFTTNMAAVVAVLLAGRVAICVLYFTATLRINPALRIRPVFDRTLIGPLVTFGGWMTVSNFILPLMMQMDRLLLGAWVSVVAVAFYTASSEVVVKLLILPRAWVSTLFPVFAAHYDNRPDHTRVLFVRGVKYLLLAMFPVVLGVVAFAHDGLLLWLGSEYAANSAPVMKIIAAGMLAYSLAYIPYSFLQSIGHPRLSAISHVIELPVFIGAAWFLTARFGINGMAWAWFARACLDMVLMFAFSFRFLPGAFTALSRVWIGLAAGGLGLWLSLMPTTIAGRFGLFLGLTAAWGLAGWFGMLTAEERDELPLIDKLRGLLKRG